MKAIEISALLIVRPHVKFVLVLARDPESKSFIEADSRIDLHNGQGYRLGTLSCQTNKRPDDVRTDAFPLHRWYHVDGTKEYRTAIRSLLNPANICFISRDDGNFIGFKPSGKALLLIGLVPTEEAFNSPTHGLKVQSARESEVLSPTGSKTNIHERKLSSVSGEEAVKDIRSIIDKHVRIATLTLCERLGNGSV
jgi:hypothetical protein